MDTIIYLDLSNNNLKKFWPMMFGYRRVPTVASVNMMNNEFVCSCSLFETWSSMSAQVNDINCMLAEDKSVKQALSSTFCLAVETEFVPKNVSQFEFEKNFCKNLYNSTSKDHLSTLALQLLSLNPPFEIEGTSLILPDKIDVIAFNKFERKVLPLKDLLNGQGLDNFELMKDEPYIFCVINTEKKQLDTPFNCRSITRKSKKQGWLLTKYIGIILGVIIAGILIFIFIGFMTTCSIIKRKPTLIRGSKRIIKQRLHSDGIIVLPKRCSKKKLMQKEQEIAEMKRYN